MEVYYHYENQGLRYPYNGFYVDIPGENGVTIHRCLVASDTPDNPKHWDKAWDKAAKLKYGF